MKSIQQSCSVRTLRQKFFLAQDVTIFRSYIERMHFAGRELQSLTVQITVDINIPITSRNGDRKIMQTCNKNEETDFLLYNNIFHKVQYQFQFHCKLFNYSLFRGLFFFQNSTFFGQCFLSFYMLLILGQNMNNFVTLGRKRCTN